MFQLRSSSAPFCRLLRFVSAGFPIGCLFAIHLMHPPLASTLCFIIIGNGSVKSVCSALVVGLPMALDAPEYD
jgi:hypothetical protein